MDYKSELLKQTRQIFTTDDLSLLWGVVNRNTLLTTIHRYLTNKTLFSIRKGLYSTVPVSELNEFSVGTAYLKGFCYVSLQSVLEINGVINQGVRNITLIGRRSQKFKVSQNSYICKKIHLKYLYNTVGINLEGSYPIASLERAVADTLYFNPKFYFDNSSGIDWEVVNLIQKNVYK